MLKEIVRLIVLLGVALGPSQVAHAQQHLDPIPVLNGVIIQLQTGTPNPNWYSPQLWQLFAIQTNNTGVYFPLQQLGTASNITVNGWIELPAGRIYSMTAHHVSGRSDWRMGINKFTNRIEYADMAVGQSQPFPLPSAPSINVPTYPAPGPSGPTAYPDPPQPDPTQPGTSTSEACQLYPDLC